MQCFIESSFWKMCSGSISSPFLVSSIGLGIGCLTFFPLLRVIIDLTSSIPELLDEPISWIPFGFGNV